MKGLNKNNYALLVGLALFLLALSVWAISILQINYNQSIFANQNLPIEQVWKAEGALLQWWNSFCTAFVIPATSILVLAGVIMLSFE